MDAIFVRFYECKAWWIHVLLLFYTSNCVYQCDVQNEIYCSQLCEQIWTFERNNVALENRFI